MDRNCGAGWICSEDRAMRPHPLAATYSPALELERHMTAPNDFRSTQSPFRGAEALPKLLFALVALPLGLGCSGDDNPGASGNLAGTGASAGQSSSAGMVGSSAGMAGSNGSAGAGASAGGAPNAGAGSGSG